jgi:exodeoxyribonuclease VII large subunit
MIKPRSSRAPAPGSNLPLETSQTSPERGSNEPDFTVSSLAGALKRTVEDRFGYVRVRGEISNYRGPHSSGHAYFCLKDDAARIDAVIWKTAFARLKIKPEEGMEVIASGKVTTYPGKSSYQIVIDALEPAGIGALMAALEERRRRLAAEGLFEAARKRPLPFLPGVIGVVTSPTGAVIRDILHRIGGRFPRRVLVWPVRVQGETSAAEVTSAILGLNALAGHAVIPSPDVIIVARGGGSLEDLWGFNDEALVRAAAASGIPLISAVGHETDWTLIDHAADLRAPTPTGAAELAVPVLLELVGTLDRLEARRTAAMLRVMDEKRAALRAIARILPQGADLLAGPRQRLDLAGARLPDGLRAGVASRRLALVRLGGRLAAQAPQARLARMRHEVENLGGRLRRAEAVLAVQNARRLTGAEDRLRAAFAGRLRLEAERARAGRQTLSGLSRRLDLAVAGTQNRRKDRLGALGQLLGGLSYRNVLARGFALVRDKEGLAVRAAALLPPGAEVAIEFADGQVHAEVTGQDRARPKPKLPKAMPAVQRQGSLF